MNKKGIVSLVLTCGICMSFLGSPVLGYDDEHPDQYVFGRTFRYDSTSGFYQTDGSYPDDGTILRLLYQEYIEGNDGKLPSEGGYCYVFMDDLIVKNGTTINGKGVTFYHNGHRLDYTSSDPNEYMLTMDRASLWIQSGTQFAQNYYDSDETASIVSKGAPLFCLNDAGYTQISDLYINGGKDIYWGNSNLSDYDDDASLIEITETSLTISNCEIEYCAGENGAVVSNENSNVISPIYLYSSSFRNCYAVNGGVAYNNNGVIEISNSSLSYNIAKNKGGAICAVDNACVRVSNCTMEGNRSLASLGGAVYLNRSIKLESESGFYVSGSGNLISTNIGGNDEKNNVYLDCSRYNEGDTTNAIMFYHRSCAVNNSIGFSYDPSNEPKVILYPKTSNNYDSGLDNAGGVFPDDPTKILDRNEDGTFSIGSRETSVKGYQSTMNEGKLTTRIFVCITEEYRLSDITINYSTKNFASNGETVTVEGQKALMDLERYPEYIYFTVDSDSAFLTEPITYEIYNGSTMILSGTFKVADYLKVVRDNSTYGYQSNNVAKAILNYGSAAQEYFNINTDELNYTDTENIMSGMTSDAFEYYEFINDKSGDVAYFYGASLGLKESPTINFYFRLKDGTSYSGPLKVRIGEETFDATYDSRTKYYSVRYKISMFDFQNFFEVTVLYQNGDEYVEDFYFNYGAMNYLYLHFTKNFDGNKKLTNLLWYLYQYSDAAKYYEQYATN